MQVQSATDTPKKIALGERAVMVDGAGYLVIRDKEAGKPVESSIRPKARRSRPAPARCSRPRRIPNAARLFYNWMHRPRWSADRSSTVARQYSAHKQAVEKPGVRKLSDIKLMKEDPEGVEKGADDIKRRYAQIFKV